MPHIAFDYLRDLPRYIPGSHTLKGNLDPVVLSANENPHGPSPKVLEALAAHQHKVHRYPPDTTELKAALRQHYGLDGLKGEIVIGAGSDELINLLARGFAAPGSKVLYSQYGFLMYPLAAKAVGAIATQVPEQHYRTDPEAIIAACADDTSIVYLANPNNPTGSYLSRTEVENLVAALPEHVLLVLDCAYSECVQAPDYSDHLALVATGRVVVTHTFSKMYALAGLRIGWGFMPAEVADILDRLRSPFNVTSLAVAAAEAALRDSDHLQHCINENQREYQRLSQALSALGMEVLPSIANFILVQFPNFATAEHTEMSLRQHGIIVRNVRGYGLPDCLRISIGTHHENTKLIVALQAIFSTASTS